MSSRGWERVGTILKPLLTRLSLDEKVALERLKREWPQLFSEPLSRHTGPADIEKGILVIAVDTPAWLQQLKFFKEDILEKVRGHGIREVRFKLGRVYRRCPETASKVSATEVAPSESDLLWIEETLFDVGPEDVREALKRALKKSVRARSHR